MTARQVVGAEPLRFDSRVFRVHPLTASARSRVGTSHRAQQCHHGEPNVVRDGCGAAVDPRIDRIRWHILVPRLLVSVLADTLNGLFFRVFRRIHNPEVGGSSPPLGIHE
jgi:hypothetical protein